MIISTNFLCWISNCKTTCFGFHQVSKREKTFELQASWFKMFSRVWKPDEILALVFEIVQLTMRRMLLQDWMQKGMHNLVSCVLEHNTRQKWYHLAIVIWGKWLWNPVKLFVVGFCSLSWALRVQKTWQNTIGGYVCSRNLPIETLRLRKSYIV